MKRPCVPWLLSILSVAIFCGCGKKSPPAGVPTSEQGAKAEQESAGSQTAPADAPPPVPAAAAQAPQAPAPVEAMQAINGVVAPALTAQLRIFIQEKGRLPENFAEFAGARLDSVPRLAPGLAFAIDPTTQEVKIVKK